MSDQNMTIHEQVLLEKCREIELLSKELYEYFAELYAGNEEALHLWRKTAVEEQNHADQFTLALKLRKGMPCSVATEEVRVDSIISQIRTVITQVKTDPPELVDALRSSIMLEKYLAEFHLNFVVKFEDDSYRNMFSAMMRSDQDHIGTLQTLYDKLSGSQEWSFSN